MRRIIAGVFVSLDGVMQAPGGPEEDPTSGFEFGGWVAPHWDEVTGENVNALHARPFDLLLGRKTYEIFSAHWPYYDDPIAQAYNRTAKHVVTSSTESLSWANSHAVHDGVDGVERLKASDGPDLLIWGSSGLYPDLLERALLDRIVIMTFPVVLGKGKRLFAPGVASGAFRVAESKISSTGVVIAAYEPAGPVSVGSFEGQAASEAELARRKRWKAEG
nr:dihydrofolate reductase family protein [uncultured Sphingosinicella sp.]